MGCCFSFSCPSCGYRAVVSGGDDGGSLCLTTTVSCDRCRVLADVVTSETPRDAASAAPIGALRCPQCGGTMAADSDMPEICRG